ncbi:phage holin family protein [Anditalea andensis]|uniref:phage holin family protein n=1 Tax=Anditalea andensis TaxID=1048983 RepID=UPI000A05239A|nr:phage holin family protein [Anditalea andensis]
MSRSRDTMGILLQLVVAALAVLITAFLLPGVAVDGYLTALVVAAMIALLNITVKPILIFLTIPITVITLGLFLLVINGLIILIAAEVIPGFAVSGFWWALLFSFILSLINSLLGVSLGGR